MPVIPISERATTILETCVSEIAARARSAAERHLNAALIGCRREVEVVLLAKLWSAMPPGIMLAGERIFRFEGGNTVLTGSVRHDYGIDGQNFRTKIPYRLKEMTLLSRGLLILPRFAIGRALLDVLLYQYSDIGVPFKARWLGVVIGPAIPRSEDAGDEDGEAELEAWLTEKMVPVLRFDERDILEDPDICIGKILQALSDLPY